MLLTLPVLGGTFSEYCFIDIDNKTHNPGRLVVVDTEDAGIVKGLTSVVDVDPNNPSYVPYCTDAYTNAVELDSYCWRFMYDPEGIYADNNSTFKKAHWLVWRLDN